MGGGQRVLIDSLYYGSTTCSCCGLEADNSAGVQFSPEVLKDFLQKLYEGFDTSEEIEASAWREVLRIMNEASVEGLLASGHTTHEQDFLARLRHSNEVFSAFKVHSMASQMQKRLRDEEGKLRSFKEWREAIAPIASHQVGSWLKTEYDTAILRAHQASDWQEFERNRDILPNLRWMPTTSPTPETTHEGFWSSGLTLPIDDPFWEEHHPANRWNCKCSLEATDDPIDRDWGHEPNKPTAQKGLEENPRHGHTFSDKHPYFPKNCKACPYYKPSGLSNKLKALFTNKSKDCYNCPYIDAKLTEAELSHKYPKDKWEHSYTSDKGGYVVTEHERIKKSRRNSTERKLFDKEMSMNKVLAKHGHKVEYLKDEDRPKGQTFDIRMNGIPTDLKSFSGAGAMIKQIKHALTEQGAEAVVVRLENDRENKLYDKLLEARRKFKGKMYFYKAETPDILTELLNE